MQNGSILQSNSTLSNPTIGDRQASHRTDEPNQSSQVIFQSNNSPNTTSFRVENRRARPKIAKNIADRGNMFFSQQANILNSSQKRHRRQIASQGADFSVMNKKDNINASLTHDRDPDPLTFESNKDQFNFTFFRERKEQKSAGAPGPMQHDQDSHVNVSSLLSHAMRNEMQDASVASGQDRFGLNTPVISTNHLGPENYNSQTETIPRSNTNSFTTNDY